MNHIRTRILIILILGAWFGKSYSKSLQYLLPNHTASDQIVLHTAYTLSYNEAYEQARWVIYSLTRDRVAGKVNRTDDFRVDPDVSTGSAELADYKGSGYDRGHLAPAADMKWSPAVMSASFYLSNMSPQLPGFNRGVWSRLESLVRDWAVSEEEIYVVTGPVLTDGLPTIGPNKVSVPHYFYKVILDYKEPELKGIGFVLANESSSADLQTFAVTIDSVESFTGMDFFPALPDDIENQVEASSVDLWTFGASAGGGGPPAATAVKVDPAKVDVPFVGSVKSTKFHKRDCRYVRQINQANLVTWPTAEAAMRAGREPCKVCNPAPVAAIKSQPKQKATSDVTVYITKTGSKYHRAGCRYLRRSMIPIKLSEAKKRYTPCSVCRPPN